MALITCKNCGKRLSDKATACPHCGMPQMPAPAAPQKSGKTKKIILGICTATVIGLTALAIAISFLTSPAPDKLNEDSHVPAGGFEEDLYPRLDDRQPFL